MKKINFFSKLIERLAMKSHLKLDRIHFNKEELYHSYKKIAMASGWAINQIPLQHVKGQPDLNGSHSLKDPKYANLKKETEIDTWYSEFEDSYIVQCLKSLPFPVYRSRLLSIEPRKCYSIHKDKGFRLHIPIYGAYDTEGKGGRFIFDHGEVLQMEEGTAYVINTNLYHTAINGSIEEKRTHLVCFLPEKEDTDNSYLLDIYNKMGV